MINALVYAIGGLTCQFPSNPSECTPTPTRVQPSDISKGGTLYLYDRGVGFTIYRLTYKKVTDAVLTMLEVIIDQAGGAALEIIDWYDHAGAQRKVRFKGPVTAKETSDGKYQVSFVLEAY